MESSLIFHEQHPVDMRLTIGSLLGFAWRSNVKISSLKTCYEASWGFRRVSCSRLMNHRDCSGP